MRRSDSETLDMLIELNRNCTCDCYYYSNIVLYNRVIWRVQYGKVDMHYVAG